MGRTDWNYFYLLALSFLIGIGQSSAVNYTCIRNAACGCSRNPSVSVRIIGGENVVTETWGWAVSIRIRSSNTHLCGGSIISPSYVLTATHCTAKLLSNPKLFRVQVGSNNISAATQSRRVVAIYDHPSYTPETFMNDISILKLWKPLDMSDQNVQRICLPDQLVNFTSSTELPSVNTSVIAIGWGKENMTALTGSTILRQVRMNVIDANSSYCRDAVLTNRSLQMCAGIMPEGGRDFCPGDSGGPLMRFTEGHFWEQVGIISFGVGCAHPGSPGIYTRVAAHQDWIQSIINGATQIKSFNLFGLLILTILYLN